MRKNKDADGPAAGEDLIFTAAGPTAHQSEPGDRAGLGTRLAAILAVGAVSLLFVMILAAALPALIQPGPGSPLDWVWQPYQGHFGILPMCLDLWPWRALP